MNDKTKVFFLPRWFPLPDDPMWGIFVLGHARSVREVADVFVLYADGTEDISKCKEPLIANVDGIPVIYMWYLKNNISFVAGFINTIRMLLCWSRLWKLGVRTFGKPDINHIHVLTRMGVFALIVKIFHDIPYVITEHWSRYLPQNFFYRGFLRRMATRIVVAHADAVMPVSEHLRNAMEKLGLKNKKYIVIPNVVDTRLFIPGRIRSETRLYTFVHVSTFDNRAKNISGIIRVTARLASLRDDFKVRFIGDGKDFEEMRQMAQQLMPEGNHAVFEGMLNAETLAGELSNSDMLLLFSNYENMPVVIPEAFSCGIPVIATKVGGIPEIVDDMCGYLIEPGDENALLELMIRILEGKTHTFNSGLIRQKATELFDERVVGMKIAWIYRSVLTK